MWRSFNIPVTLVFKHASNPQNENNILLNNKGCFLSVWNKQGVIIAPENHCIAQTCSKNPTTPELNTCIHAFYRSAEGKQHVLILRVTVRSPNQNTDTRRRSHLSLACPHAARPHPARGARRNLSSVQCPCRFCLWSPALTGQSWLKWFNSSLQRHCRAPPPPPPSPSIPAQTVPSWPA